MIAFSPEQLKTFGDLALGQFKAEMRLHLCGFSPALARSIDDQQQAQIVELCLARAKNYGFSQRGPVRLYLEMMLLLGSDFDTDPQYLWAQESLKGSGDSSQSERAKALYEAAQRYVNAVHGADDALFVEALKSVATFARQPFDWTTHHYLTNVTYEIGRVYPAKFKEIGDAGVQRLIRKAIESAQLAGLATVRGVTLIVFLMFFFGHGCLSDPLYPWLSETLTSFSASGHEEVASRLERRALVWLDRAVTHFEQAQIS
jgi:hypothetical protein